LRYRSAVGEPGANDVLVHEGGLRPKPRALRASSPAAINRRGSVVLVQLVMAAMATAPSPGSSRFARSGVLGEHGQQRSMGRPGRYPILWPLRPRHTDLHLTEVDFDEVGKARLRHWIEPKTLALCVVFDEPHTLFRRPVIRRYWMALTIESGKSRIAAELRRHVRNDPRDRRADSVVTPSPKNSTNLSARPIPRRRCVMVSARSVASTPFTQCARAECRPHRAPASSPACRQVRFRLRGADTPTQHPNAVDHRRVAVGPDHVSGIAQSTPSRSSDAITLASRSRFSVCMIPVSGRWARTCDSVLVAHFISW